MYLVAGAAVMTGGKLLLSTIDTHPSVPVGMLLLSTIDAHPSVPVGMLMRNRMLVGGRAEPGKNCGGRRQTAPSPERR